MLHNLVYSVKKIIITSIIIILLFLGFYMIKKGSFLKPKFTQFSISTDNIKKISLSNGMTILLYPIKESPKVLVQIAYNIGSYVEESGQKGYAHLVEHMIFKGTSKLSEGDINTIARKYGATYNAFTNFDVTSYFFETNKNNWEYFIEILADCMQNVCFDPQCLASELKTVIQELKMGRDSYWKSMLLKAYELGFLPNHPYHTPTIGYKEDILNVTSEKLKNFYKKYYGPNRALLIIIGDFDVDKAEALARKYFEPVPTNKENIIKEFPMIPAHIITNKTSIFEDVKHAQLAFYWTIPGLTDKNEIFPSVLEYLLGGGEGSRLFRLLIDEKKIATNVTVKASKNIGGGLFLILVEPVPGKNDRCNTVITQELEKIMLYGFTYDEIIRMVNNKTRVFLEKLQNYKDFSYNWIKSYFSTNDPFIIFDRVNKYAQVTPQTLKQYVKTYLDPFLMNRIEVLPIPISKKAVNEKSKKLAEESDKNRLKKVTRTKKIIKSLYAQKLQAPKMLDFTFPKPDSYYTLNNGLKVTLKKTTNLPLITLVCNFNDSDYFNNSLEGATINIMMDTLMEGSLDFSKKDNVNFFEYNGVYYSFSAKGITISMLNHNYHKIFKRLVHILTKPTFPRSAIEKLKTIVINNLERNKDNIKSVLIRNILATVYKDHPYGWTIEQAINLVKKINDIELVKKHMEYIIPADMNLVVVGNFDLDEMEKTIKRTFGLWPSGTPKKITYVQSKFVPGEQIKIQMLRNQVAWAACRPSALTINHKDLVPVKLLNYIAFVFLGSRVFQLREQTGLFYTAFGKFGANAGKTPGFDYIGTLVNPDKVKEAESKIIKTINDLASKGVMNDELDSARQMYLKKLIDATATNKAMAKLFSDIQALNLGFDYYDKVLAKIQTITLKEINAIASRYFSLDNMAYVQVGQMK